MWPLQGLCAPQAGGPGHGGDQVEKGGNVSTFNEGSPGLEPPADTLSTSRSPPAYAFNVETSGPPRVPAAGSDNGATADVSCDEPEETGTRTFVGLNNFTNGTEFYGPAANLSFLLELRSLARARGTEIRTPESRFSADELYPDSDMIIESEYASRFAHPEINFPIPSRARSNIDARARDQVQPAPSSSVLFDLDIEVECIQVYFTNLHLLYGILNETAFLARCREEIWSLRPPNMKIAANRSPNSKTSRFLSLYCAVLAVGALTAGDGSLLVKDAQRVRAFLSAHTSPTGGAAPAVRNHVRPSFELAYFFHVCTKALLGDIFEASSLEVSQTLLLMSIFNHYSLRPHAAHMCNGIAARTAFGMGMAQTVNLSLSTVEAIGTWWAFYVHEIEVCCALGREISLREPSYYSVYVSPLPTPLPERFAQANDPKVFYGRGMTALAKILRQASEDLYHPSQRPSLQQDAKRLIAMDLDAKLLEWKRVLAGMYDLDSHSLTEPEEVTKRKIILQLRFQSARIYIHRSFLVEAASAQQGQELVPHVELCRQAAEETVVFLYDTLRHRPFFRSWYYNVMYNFQATAVILFVLVLRPAESERLLALVDKSLEIFKALDASSVARKCAFQTQEILDAIKSLRENKATIRGNVSDPGPIIASTEAPLQPRLDFDTMDFSQDNDFSTTRPIGSEMLETPGIDVEHLGWSLASPNPNLFFMWDELLK